MKQGIFDKSELQRSTVQNIIKLLHSIWPYKEGEMNIEEAVEDYIKNDSLSINKSILIWENDVIVGHTEIFSREIESSQRMINNMALAGVCVRPGYRGKNYGYELVRKAFDLLNGQGFECSVFQTDIPDFYKKFGSRIITNKFINSHNTENPNGNPWWTDEVMIYPGDYDIGTDIIDLKGKGY